MPEGQEGVRIVVLLVLIFLYILHYERRSFGAIYSIDAELAVFF